MAARKKAVDVTEEVETPLTFSKEQILESAKYSNRRDLINALLVDGESYTFETVDKKIEDFMKGKVK